MKLYDAIHEMRKISREGGSFSFSFMSYDRGRQKSSGIVEVARARLRPGQEGIDELGIMEEYTDITTGEARRFYQPCLMNFNGQTCEL